MNRLHIPIELHGQKIPGCYLWRNYICRQDTVEEAAGTDIKDRHRKNDCTKLKGNMRWKVRCVYSHYKTLLEG